MDSRFNIGPSFKKYKKKKHIIEDERFNKLKDIDKIEKYTDAIVDPFGRPLGFNKSAAFPDDKFKWDIDHSESDSDVENLEEESSIWVKDKDVQLGDSTDRIAVVCCDWDNINATDIYALFQTMYESYASLKNTEAVKVVKRACIYLSEFGKTMVPLENINGPTLVISSTSSNNNTNEDLNTVNLNEINDKNEADQDEELDDKCNNSEGFRKYQLEKSRYYYAVVELINVDVANILYDELDGVEVEFAIDSLDLRFIPPGIQFTDNPVSEATSIPPGYKPPVANISALRHSKVTCSWDTTPAKRTKILTGKYSFDKLNEIDIDGYLASDHTYSDVDDNKSPSSNGSDCSDITNTTKKTSVNAVKSLCGDARNGKVNNYRELLLNNSGGDKYDKFGNKKGQSVAGKAGQFIISFNSRLDKSKDSSDDDFESEYSDTVDDSTSDGELGGIVCDKGGDKNKYKGEIKNRERKPDRIDSFEADLDDPRFAKVFTGENYEIDITNPNYRPTLTSKSMLNKRRKNLSRN